jgi:hypothetical protein
MVAVIVMAEALILVTLTLLAAPEYQLLLGALLASNAVLPLVPG